MAADFFKKSGLSVDYLRAIWCAAVLGASPRAWIGADAATSVYFATSNGRSLADFDNAGSLDAAGFVIAMFLITSIRSGTLAQVPDHLPPELLASARPPGAAAGGSVPAGPTVSVPTSTSGSPAPAGAAGAADWAIAEEEMARAMPQFMRLDTGGKGFLTGMSRSPPNGYTGCHDC